MLGVRGDYDFNDSKQKYVIDGADARRNRGVRVQSLCILVRPTVRNRSTKRNNRLRSPGTSEVLLPQHRSDLEQPDFNLSRTLSSLANLGYLLAADEDKYIYLAIDAKNLSQAQICIPTVTTTPSSAIVALPVPDFRTFDVLQDGQSRSQYPQPQVAGWQRDTNGRLHDHLLLLKHADLLARLWHWYGLVQVQTRRLGPETGRCHQNSHWHGLPSSRWRRSLQH